jgi:hypothetical protein
MTASGAAHFPGSRPVSAGKHIAKRHLTGNYSSTGTIWLVLYIVFLTCSLWKVVAKIFATYTPLDMIVY